MQDIADAVGVSKVSVHKALTNQKGISEDLRKQIISKADELGYKVIDPIIKYSSTFYFVIHKKFTFSFEQYYTSIMNQLRSFLQNIGAELNILTVGDNYNINKFIDYIKAKKVSTPPPFFLAGGLPKQIYECLRTNNIPAVCIDFDGTDFGFDSVLIDNYSAFVSLTNYLINRGHTNPCLVMPSKCAATNMDKYFGFRKALWLHDIPFTENMHLDLDIMDAARFSAFVLPKSLPSVFMCDTDHCAHYLMIKLQSYSLRIPEDVSVTGFGNNSIATETFPSLTTIGENKKEVAMHAYSLMLHRLEKPNSIATVKYVRTKIYERSSVK